jgi:hypothetical protein
MGARPWGLFALRARKMVGFTHATPDPFQTIGKSDRVLRALAGRALRAVVMTSNAVGRQ